MRDTVAHIASPALAQLLVACGVEAPGRRHTGLARDRKAVSGRTPLSGHAVDLLRCGWGVAAALAHLSGVPGVLPKPAMGGGGRRVSPQVAPAARRAYWEAVSALLVEKCGVALPMEKRELLLCGDAAAAIEVLESALCIWPHPQEQQQEQQVTERRSAAGPEEANVRVAHSSSLRPPGRSASSSPSSSSSALSAGQSSPAAVPTSRDHRCSCDPKLEQLMQIQQVQQQYLEQCLFYAGAAIRQWPRPLPDGGRESRALRHPHELAEARRMLRLGQPPAIVPGRRLPPLAHHTKHSSVTGNQRDDSHASAAMFRRHDHSAEGDAVVLTLLTGVGDSQMQPVKQLRARSKRSLPPIPITPRARCQQPTRCGGLTSTAASQPPSSNEAVELRMRLRLRDRHGQFDRALATLQSFAHAAASALLISARHRRVHEAALLIQNFCRLRLHIVRRRRGTGALAVDPYRLQERLRYVPRRIGCVRCWPVLLALRERLAAEPLLCNNRVRAFGRWCCDACRQLIASDDYAALRLPG